MGYISSNHHECSVSVMRKLLCAVALEIQFDYVKRRLKQQRQKRTATKLLLASGGQFKALAMLARWHYRLCV